MKLDELGEEAKKENILSLMMSMSEADGVIHDNEMMYILQLGFSMGLDETKIRELSGSKRSDMFVPTSEADRMTIFYYLVFLIKVDGEISKDEKNMMHHFGLKLGFNHLMIDNIIRVVEANLGKRMHPNAILREIKKHLN